MKNLIIFASHIPDKKHIHVGESILNTINQYIPNNKIYIGVNNSCNEWLDKISEFDYEITPDRLLAKSDASAYQSALRCFYNSKDNTEYDNVIFLHTQATKSGRHSVRQHHLDCLLKNHNKVIDELYSHELHGIYGATMTVVGRYSKNLGEIWDTLGRYYDFPYTPFPYMCMGTMFTMKYKILKEFLFNCDESFFNEILWTVQMKDQTDLWFFERDFNQIAFRQGYIPKYKYMYNNYPKRIKNFDEKSYLNDLNAWANDNNIELPS